MAHANSKGYLGSNKLKRANVSIRLTPAQQEEMLKCYQDPVYFIRKYIVIRSVDHGRVPFDMYPFQEEMVRLIHEERFSLINCARQIGKSTVLLAYACWAAIFNDDYEIAILANKGKTSTGLLRKFRAMYEDIPMWMQQGCVEANKTTMEFENKSMVYCTATSADSIRGDSVNLVIVDETAFIKSDLWEDFWDSTLPTISSGKTSKMCLISTPKGMNHWYDFVVKARKGIGFKIKEVYWYDHPDRDESWKQEQIDKTSDSKFLQEHELEFLGSSGSLIGVSDIKRIETMKPIQEFWDEQYKIYKLPEAGRIYAAGVDTGYGVGLDYSVINIVDITTSDFEQVAVYRSNTISHTMFPDVIYQIGTQYNNAHLIIENNDVGLTVSDTMVEVLDYENVYNPDKLNEQGNDRSGVRSTTTTKRIGCNNFKTLIEHDKLKINDFQTLREISNFNKTKKGTSYEASSGNDDLVMSLVIFSWAVKQDNFIDITGISAIDEINAKLREEMFDTPLEETIPPLVVPFLDDFESDNSYYQTDNYKPSSW